jgi:hypothetical protein
LLLTGPLEGLSLLMSISGKRKTKQTQALEEGKVLFVVQNSKTLPTTLLGVAELKDWKTSLQIITIDKGSRHHR